MNLRRWLFVGLLLLVSSSCKNKEHLVAAPKFAKLEATPNPLVFGDVGAGLTRLMRVRISNTGDLAVDLKIPSIEASDPEIFWLPAQEYPSRLDLGEDAEITVAFSPKADGATSAALHLLDLEGAKLVTVRLEGNGGGPYLAFDPPSLDFGRQPARSETRRSVSLENVSNPTGIVLLDYEIDGENADAFSVTPVGLPSEIGLEDLQLEIVFHSIREGEMSANLVVHTSSPEQPVLRLPLHGEGMPPVNCQVTIDPAEVRFGIVDSEVLSQRDIRLVNKGASGCPLWGLQFQGPDKSLFSLADQPPDNFVIAPSESLVLTVGLKAPGRDGAVQAGLSFGLGNGDTPRREVLLYAQLVAGLDPYLDPITLEFEPTPIDRLTVGMAAVRLRRSGTVNMVGAGWGNPTSEAFDFGRSSNYDGVIRADRPYAIPVIFEPKTLGLHTGTVEFLIEGFAEPLRMTIVGHGIAPCGDGPCQWPKAECSPDGEVVAGRQTAVVSTNAGAETCQWSVAVGDRTSRMSDTDPSSCQASFVPWIVGDYLLDHMIVGESGRGHRCRIPVHADPPKGIWIEARDQAEWFTPLLTLLHSDGGDPDDRDSWINYSQTCSAQGMFLQDCSWDDTQGDPSGVFATNMYGVTLMGIRDPSVSHPYFVGMSGHGTPLEPRALRSRIYCAGRLVNDEDVNFKNGTEFQVIGKLEMTSATTCQFTRDDARWSLDF
ncbi:choice-of-anchor D domain-containing protein [Vulgatibacter incomptus]|uniref:Putative lipoprotein n=1 Tax=Vulgatibacter incomptus TaxID=1391653 RepID=A0A0K1PDE8_9BACT|nr:choice-of-anchor D domain-containing protein [Vulgatibacter incomptus]AKU91144.1 putative lipoprotein [Vulgatibacter incomptus]